MNHSIMRALVITVAVTGFAASTVVSQGVAKKPEIKPIVFGTACPAPMCLPHDPTHCGMD